VIKAQNEKRRDMPKINFELNKIIFIFLTFFMSSTAFGIGPDFADDVYSEGKAEHVVCGIDIYRINLTKIIETFGKPTKVKIETDKDDKQYDPGSGSKEYIWSLPHVEMHLYSGYYTDTKTGKIIETAENAIAVLGSKPNGKIGFTGQGLALGDSFSKVENIYGKLIQVRGSQKTGDLHLQVTWHDSTYLSIDFDADGRVKSIRLFADEG
jgi:hypothetical protein